MKTFVSVVLILVCTALAPVAAQEQPAAEARLTDPFGRTTPRGTVDGLIAAFASGQASAVLPYLDLDAVADARRRLEGARAARNLEAALDRAGGLLPGYRISAAPEGQASDGLPPDVDAFAQIVRAGTITDLTLTRSEVESIPVWRVSSDSLALVATLPATNATLFDRIAPAALQDGRWFGSSPAAWAAIAILGMGGIAAGLAMTWLLLVAAGLFSRGVREGAAGRLLRPLRLPIGLVLGAVVFQIAAFAVGVPTVARAAVAPIVEIGAWLAIAWTILRLVGASGEEVVRRMTLRERLGAVSVVVLGRRLATAAIVAVAVLLIAGSLGLDFTGWLAALGIGGLALALGAQKTIEHIMGGVSLVADQPIRVGDFCAVDGVLGTVEDIGLRSTRLRTLDRTLVTIPNGDLAAARIENYAGRDRFRWLTTLGLRYETTPDQMRALRWRLDQLLAGDARVAEDHRVRFVGFGASSLDVEVFAYLVAPDYAASLTIREELNLAVMEIVAECGTAFAFPSTTVYLAQDQKPAPAEAQNEVGMAA